MRFIERLGGHVIDYGVQYMITVAIASLLTIAYILSTRVILSPEMFDCTATDAVGIQARCTQFTMKRLYNDYGHKNQINQ